MPSNDGASASGGSYYQQAEITAGTVDNKRDADPEFAMEATAMNGRRTWK